MIAGVTIQYIEHLFRKQRTFNSHNLGTAKMNDGRRCVLRTRV